jgi:hypothetical protein
MQLYINNTYGFLHHNTLIKCNKYIKSSVQDYQYEYQIDWNSGEVPWDFIELDNVLYNQDNNINIPVPATIDIEVVMPDRSMDSTIVINTDFDNIMITKAIVSGVMKGIYIQIVSIDNMITYTQCYTNKVIDMDIVLSLLYVILYETNKVNEKNNIIILKKYNNIQLFEKYIKLRRNSMILIIIMYVLLFREISNVE